MALFYDMAGFFVGRMFGHVYLRSCNLSKIGFFILFWFYFVIFQICLDFFILFLVFVYFGLTRADVLPNLIGQASFRGLVWQVLNWRQDNGSSS
jgi:hypothetical protein